MGKLNYFNYYNRIRDDENVLFSYKGAVNDAVLMEICEDIRQKLDIEEVYNRKIFSTFIELVQNQIYYAADKYLTDSFAKESIGLIILSQSENSYNLTTGNLITEENLLALRQKLDYLHNLSPEELRSRKRTQRMDAAKKEDESSAGIGMIKAITVSDNPLSIDFVKIENDLYFFTLTALFSMAKKNLFSTNSTT